MIKAWIGAGILSLVAAIAREIVGYNTNLAVAISSNMDNSSIVFYHIAWHVITGVCLLAFIAFIYIGLYPRRLASSQIAWIFNSIFALTAVTVVVVSSFMGWAIDMAAPIVLSAGIAVLGAIGAVQCSRLVPVTPADHR